MYSAKTNVEGKEKIALLGGESGFLVFQLSKLQNFSTRTFNIELK